jgi:hypothetical protein
MMLRPLVARTSITGQPISFGVIGRLEFGARGSLASTLFAKTMRAYTLKEKAKITAGAVTALVIVAWLAIIALALLSA